MNNTITIFEILEKLYQQRNEPCNDNTPYLVPVDKAFSNIKVKVNMVVSVPIQSLSDFINLKKGKVLTYSMDSGMEASIKFSNKQ